MAYRSRIRTVDFPFSIPYGHRDVPGGGFESYPNLTGYYTRNYSEIVDQVNTRPYPESACFHRRGVFDGPDGIAVWMDDQQYGDQRVIVGSIGTPPADPDVTYTVSDAKRWQTAVTMALDRQCLAPVFLKELPEIKGTYKTLKAKGFGLKSFANKYLAYKFGIVPFLSDLVDLANGSELIAQHIKRVNAMKGIRQRVVLNIGDVSGSSTYWQPTGAYSAIPCQASWHGSTYIVAHVEVFRRYEAQDTLNLYADYYGGRLAAVVWEMIPYSFVVDWFVSVGDIIDLLGPKFQPQMARPLNASTIVKASINLPVMYWQPGSGPCTLGSRRWEHFSRTPCASVTPSSLVGSGLTVSRATVGAALLLQKL